MYRYFRLTAVLEPFRSATVQLGPPLFRVSLELCFQVFLEKVVIPMPLSLQVDDKEIPIHQQIQKAFCSLSTQHIIAQLWAHFLKDR